MYRYKKWRKMSINPILSGGITSMFQCPVFRNLYADLGGDSHPDHPIRMMLEEMINVLLDAEMDIFLAGQIDRGVINKRNGKIQKRVRSNSGTLDIRTPRDRRGDFRPRLIPKWVKDVSIPMEVILLCLYSQHSLEVAVPKAIDTLYQGELDDSSLDFLSNAAINCIKAFRSRPIDAYHTLVFVQTYSVGDLAGKFSLCPDEWLAIFTQSADGVVEVLYLYDRSFVSWPEVIENLRDRGLTSFRSLNSDLSQRDAENLISAFSVTGIRRMEAEAS